MDTKSISETCRRWNIQTGEELQEALQSADGIVQDAIKRVRSRVKPAPLPSKIVGREASLIILDDPTPMKMAEGCCSAISPCSHQQKSPFTICNHCQEAHGYKPAYP